MSVTSPPWSSHKRAGRQQKYVNLSLKREKSAGDVNIHFKKWARIFTDPRSCKVNIVPLFTETENDKTLEFMFAGINMFWARLKLILARAKKKIVPILRAKIENLEY